MRTATNPQSAGEPQSFGGRVRFHDSREADRVAWQTAILLLFWNHRRELVCTTAIGFLVATAVAFLIPATYTSTTQLMPPDSQSSSGLAMISALAKVGGGLGSMTGDLLGLKSTGDLFVGMLRSETCQVKLVQQFDLKRVYGVRLTQEARSRLDERTSISQDRKSGIISIRVSDRSPQRAAALANAYVDQLNRLATELSTSSAHRERLFLEGRLQLAKLDLDQASGELAEFASKNSTPDIQQMGKAMLDAAGNIAGQLIATESELEGLRQIYTDDTARVQSVKARVLELRRQLAGLDGHRAEITGRLAAQAASPASAGSREMPYPSLRSLPLLGEKYADYYRHAKIQETVYELLTEQYELAKIQEAKESPSVKVLDGATIPEKKSSPARMLIITLGTFVAFAGCVLWAAGSSNWRATDPLDPRKVVVQEALNTLKARIPRLSPKRVAIHE
jgi:uncharacterized protein involved in exopolysaccharide biosynthesis